MSEQLTINSPEVRLYAVRLQDTPKNALEAIQIYGVPGDIKRVAAEHERICAERIAATVAAGPCSAVGTDPTVYELFQLAGIIHEARMKECYGNWNTALRQAWPKDFKEYRTQQQAGQSWITIAVAQAHAVYPLLRADALPPSPEHHESDS